MKRAYVHLFASISLLLASDSPASGQSEAVLRSFFEGREVVLKMDMPGDKSGVDVHPESSRPVDCPKVGGGIRDFGVALYKDDAVMVTLVKVKTKNIEFHLGGGGARETGGPYISTHVPKSNREKRLDDAHDKETDPARKKRLKEDLDDERRRRRYEEERLRREAERAIERLEDFEMTRMICAAVAICLSVACGNPEGQAEATGEKREALEKALAERQAEAIKQNAVEAERYAAEAAQIEAAIAGCEYIKTIQNYGSSRVAVYINSDFPREHAYFLAAAEKHFRDSNYVYFFTDRGKASAWNPTDFGPGPQHDSVLGRVYRDGDYREYTPQSEWISLSP